MTAKLTAAACRAARGLLGWTVRDLMRAASVSPNTVTTLEDGGSVRPETEAKIVAAFARHGVEITNGTGTGAHLHSTVWRVDFAKGRGRFTAQPASGQPPRMFPDFATQHEVRQWLEQNGYRALSEPEDLWVASA
ncbi:hypothetical protein [Phenylobacterium montanum]|uniref:Uncharacterized protein n=1 Tax=Phenylobacterium montanum TaxID=2823693 RepID=A0A975FXX0_9CAUL|nr:hypothetical protein [Caulobacter sp. S6]QUD86962.1 hypothetical protein KCG34_18065 [Caulobacter sp. S6]